MMRWCLFVLLMNAVNAVWAQPTTSQGPSQRQPSHTLASFQALKALERKLLENLERSDAERQKLEHTIRQVRLDLTTKNQDLNRLAIQKDVLEAELLPLERKVRARLKARQVSLKRGEAFLRLLLQEGGATRFMTSRGYLNAIAALDLKMMQEYQERKAKLLANEAEIEQSTESLKKLELKLAKKAVKIDVLNEERFMLLEQAKREKRKAEVTAKRLGLAEEVELPITNELSFIAAKGKMPRPVQGTLLRRFGIYRNTSLKTTHRSNGWLLSVGASTDVRAVHRGKVIYSGPFKGYGHLVILEHSPRFHTIYGQLSNATVTVNQAVSTSESIGTIVKSKRNRRPRLYFEIRKEKKPTDPARYLGR